jgi:hypothetical protein
MTVQDSTPNQLGPFTTRFLDSRRRSNFVDLVIYLSGVGEIDASILYKKHHDFGGHMTQDEMISDLVLLAQKGVISFAGQPIEVYTGNEQVCFIGKIKYDPSK